MTKPLVIYHGNCADGFTGAWVANKVMDAEFHAGIYGNQPPSHPDVVDRDVYFVDFTYKRPVLEEIRDKAKSLTILDHHATAEEDLRDLPGVTCIFDMNRSGARIAWDFWFPKMKPPQALLHVEDRDLWRFALPGTREIQSNIFSYPYEFEVWDKLMHGNVDELIAEGRAIERKHHKDIAELVQVVTRRMNIGGYNVPIANLPYTLTSDAGALLGKGEPFAGCYWDTPHGRVFSLRSAPDGMDVGQIAKMYGGGGHPHASGFMVSYDVARTFEV